MNAVNIKAIPLVSILDSVKVRSIKDHGVATLKDKIQRLGFQIDKPLRVHTVDGGYRLIDGNHRLEAAKSLNLSSVYAVIVDPPDNELDAIQQARESNEASEAVVKTTFIDDAELVWKLTESFTQEQAAKAMGGWSREAVKNYKSLQKIDAEAWGIIGTGFKNIVPDSESDDVPDSGTGVPKSSFSENLLRNILDLQPDQQIDLCKRLVKGKDSKGHKFGKADFKAEAEGYRALNALVGLAQSQLTAIIPGSLDQDPLLAYWTPIQQALSANKEYVAEYLKAKAPGEKFAKLIQAAVDDWQQKSNVQVIVKDIRLLTALDIADDSVDCIITDPPYPKEYVDLFDDLGALAARVLKPGGSLVVMTGQLYLPRYLELLAKHLNYHWLLAYTTPGGQAVQIWNQEVNTFWKPLLWFVKDQRDARWVSDVINTPVNANDKQHHHWGQSVSGMTAIVEKFSNPGDLVLDPFLGGGTTGVVCKATGRRFVGVELDDVVAAQSLARIHGGA